MEILINIPNMDTIEDTKDINQMEHSIQCDNKELGDISEMVFHNTGPHDQVRCTLRNDFLNLFVKNPDTEIILNWLVQKSEELKAKVLNGYSPDKSLTAQEQKILMKPRLSPEDIAYYSGFNSMFISNYWTNIRDSYLKYFGDKSCYLFYYCNIADTSRLDAGYFMAKIKKFTQKENDLSKKLFDYIMKSNQTMILYFDNMFSSAYSINISHDNDDTTAENLNYALKTMVKQGGRLYGVVTIDKQKKIFGLAFEDGECQIMNKEEIDKEWNHLDCFHDTYINGLYELNI